jgi:molecular chaperone GrpE
MPQKKEGRGWNRIPIKFLDSETENGISSEDESEDSSVEKSGAVEENPPDGPSQNEMTSAENQASSSAGPAFEDDADSQTASQPVTDQASRIDTGELGGPLVAELVATRAELKRVEAEVADLKDRLARRQADFENYRKRVERERSDTYERVVAEVTGKLLPVLDNLKRALDSEATVEASESDEFRHFLSGVDLIFKQLNGVLEALGVKPIMAVGSRFDPHIHEAVVSEPTDDYEPDTVMQEIIRGYRLGDKLIRPALVKVAVKK